MKQYHNKNDLINKINYNNCFKIFMIIQRSENQNKNNKIMVVKVII
jgi:hypothetical protein